MTRLAPLTATDAAFLHQETGAAHMSVGGLGRFDGPGPTIEELRRHTLRRLHLIPRYRQRLVYPPAGIGRPLWADDPDFDIARHVRREVLPEPGGDAELWDLYARVWASRIDRDHPLWELYLVEGMEGGRFAIIAKNHHALTDGISNIDVLNALWDLEPSPGESDRDSDEPWTPAPGPSSAELVGAGVSDAASTTLSAARGALGLARRPREAVRVAGRSAEGVAEVGRALVSPAPTTPFNVTVGERRSFRTVYASLDDIKRVKNAFDATVNDVMLTIVAGGVARLLRARDVDPREVMLRPVVPVSIRTADQKYQLGNRVVTVRPRVPAAMRDPREHLRAVHREMDRLKRSTQPSVVEVLEGVMNWAPPVALGPVARLAFHPRLFNLLVSNIPGPQFPLYLLGRQALDMVACGFLAERQTVAVAAVSYNGKLGFGLLADPDVVPDLELMAQGIERSLAELLQAAERHEPVSVRRTHPPAAPVRG